MEDELTCPVCLELYADPLLLPCSHSLCKKCLHDILDNRTKAGKEGLECPSCRKSLSINKDRVRKLPRNLALENIVFRFQELKSENLASRKSPSVDLNLELKSPTSPSSPIAESPVFEEGDNSEVCGLCDDNTQSRASIYCEQCCIAYCQSCLETFHPRRGKLTHHRLRKPGKHENTEKPAFCEDHQTEVAAIFCDDCKSLVCHLCVCDEVGKHAKHKILSLDTAWTQTKEMLCSTKDSLESMTSTLSEQTHRIEEITEEVETIHVQACQKMDTQYLRLLEDITASLQTQQQTISRQLTDSKKQMVTKLGAKLDENRQHCKQLENLMESCKKLLDEDHKKGLLSRAAEVQPLQEKVRAMKEILQSRKQIYQDLQTDKSVQQEMKNSVTQFKSAAQSCLSIIIADDAQNCQSIIPVIKSPTSPGKEAPRVQNKCLTTWGFNSTSFTAEPLKHNSLWSVTIEKNSSHLGDIKTGYLFGVGISSDKLNFKDQVGLNGSSHGIVCSGGNLTYCHNGRMEQLMSLDCLPLSITIYVTIDQSEGVILAYTFTNATWGDTLYGKKVLLDRSLRKVVYPVFTVSQRVKMQFPTYV